MSDEEIRAQVLAQIRYLAGVCDYADQPDGAGFNKVDTWIGHELAALSELSLAEFSFAAGLCRKYGKQVRAAGFTPPTPEEIAAHIGEHTVEEFTRAGYRQQKREEADAQREAEYQAARARAEAERKATNPDRVYLKQGRVVVQFAYDPQKVEAMKPLKKAIKEWAFNKFFTKEWSFPKAAIGQVLEAIAPFADEFQFEGDLEEARQQAEAEAELARQQAELEARAREAERQALLEKARPFLDGAPLPNGQTLFAHQREAIERLLLGRHMILAHDMGLGKTKSALVAAKCYDLPIFVICPASLKINWLREAEMVGVAIEVYSWAKLPTPLEDQDYLLIADESHYAANLKSQRTQGFLELAKKARAVYCLTGTPMPNGRPAELFPLLLATHHPLAEDRRTYERYYCAAHMKSVGRRDVYDATGAAHLDELHKKTQDTLLYKKKEACLKDLPPKMRIMREAETSSEAEKAYHGLIDLLRAQHAGRMKEKREAYEQALKAALENGEEDLPESPDSANAEALVELGALRHAGSQIKVESALAIAKEVLQQGESIVLFVEFLDTGRHLADALACDFLCGGTSVEQRQQMIDLFQSKERRALVCMGAAGGVGITLTAAQTVLLVDRPWRPGDAEQEEDRLHRIGQAGSVTAIWLQYGEIDSKIDTLLEQKQERIDLVLEGQRKTMRGVSKSLASMAKELVSAALADTTKGKHV